MSAAILTARQVEALLARGHPLHMEICDGMRVWWFDAAEALVPDQVVARIVRRGRLELVPADDVLFDWPDASQTWRAVRCGG